MHLIAEYRELPMVIGSLRINDWRIKSEVPDTFNLGTGHINFLKTKLVYLKHRHNEVIQEMFKRHFKHDKLNIDLSNCPPEYCNDWQPSMLDSIKIRKRIFEKIMFNTLPITWWRYKGIPLNIETARILLLNVVVGELYPV